jgi:hypothetical protein
MGGIHEDTYGANSCNDEEHVELQSIYHHSHKLPVFSYLQKQTKKFTLCCTTSPVVHTILKLADHVLSKIVRYVILVPLRPELDGQDPFQICEACVKLEKRRL